MIVRKWVKTQVLQAKSNHFNGGGGRLGSFALCSFSLTSSAIDHSATTHPDQKQTIIGSIRRLKLKTVNLFGEMSDGPNA